MAVSVFRVYVCVSVSASVSVCVIICLCLCLCVCVCVKVYLPVQMSVCVYVSVSRHSWAPKKSRFWTPSSFTNLLVLKSVFLRSDIKSRPGRACMTIVWHMRHMGWRCVECEYRTNASTPHAKEVNACEDARAKQCDQSHDMYVSKSRMHHVRLSCTLLDECLRFMHHHAELVGQQKYPDIPFKG
jgi:hypothetical protein